VYIDYVRRSRSSSCRLLRPINCQTYITLHYTDNYGATSSNMKLVQCAVDKWAVTFGTVRRPGPSSLYRMQQPTHQRSVYQSPYCCVMVRYSAVLMCPQRVNLLLTITVRCVDNNSGMTPKSKRGGPTSYRNGDILVYFLGKSVTMHVPADV